MPVNVTIENQPDLTDHLTPPEMAVYYLSHLPYAEQLRWRGQHCLGHSQSRATDLALAQWEPFGPFLHHRHIRTDLPTAPVDRSSDA